MTFPLDLESLELLLLLRRSPDTYWTAEAAAQKLGIGAETARSKLSQLVKAQVLVQGRDTGAYRFAPASEEKLRAFADAFLLKSEKNE